MLKPNLKKIWSVRTLIAKVFRKKIRRQAFIVYVLIYPLSKSGGNWTNSLWVLAFTVFRFKWKNWFEKTALNRSIRRVIFTSGQNFKPPFLCQYLIFCNDFFSYFKLSIWRYTVTLTSVDDKSIVHLKFYIRLPRSPCSMTILSLATLPSLQNTHIHSTTHFPFALIWLSCEHRLVPWLWTVSHGFKTVRLDLSHNPTNPSSSFDTILQKILLPWTEHVHSDVTTWRRAFLLSKKPEGKMSKMADVQIW